MLFFYVFHYLVFGISGISTYRALEPAAYHLHLLPGLQRFSLLLLPWTVPVFWVLSGVLLLRVLQQGGREEAQEGLQEGRDRFGQTARHQPVGRVGDRDWSRIFHQQGVSLRDQEQPCFIESLRPLFPSPRSNLCCIL